MEEVILITNFSGIIYFLLPREEEFFQQKDQIFILQLLEILDRLKNSLPILMQIQQQYKDQGGDG